MKIKQKKAEFEPITITIESCEGANVFFSLVDKIDAEHCHDGETLELESDEYKIIMDLSNARSSMLNGI